MSTGSRSSILRTARRLWPYALFATLAASAACSPRGLPSKAAEPPSSVAQRAAPTSNTDAEAASTSNPAFTRVNGETDEPPQALSESAASALGQRIDLDVPGFAPALLELPNSLAAIRPVLIAAHGAGDTPEDQCDTWRELVAGRAFILCPRGVRLTANPSVPSGYFYPNHFELEKELLAALFALERAYPNADTSRMVYTGYSQGATMGALVVFRQPERFPRLALIEGGAQDFSRSSARRLSRVPSARVLFACGIQPCSAKARRAQALLSAEGVPVRVLYAAGAGHIYGGDVFRLVSEAFSWLVAGEARWATD